MGICCFPLRIRRRGQKQSSTERERFHVASHSRQKSKGSSVERGSWTAPCPGFSCHLGTRRGGRRSYCGGGGSTSRVKLCVVDREKKTTQKYAISCLRLLRSSLLEIGQCHNFLTLGWVNGAAIPTSAWGGAFLKRSLKVVELFY